MEATLDKESPAATVDKTEIVIRAIDVKRHYGSGDSVTRALDGVTVDIFRGEYLSIMGPSGSGKTTLFNMIGGIDSPTDGMVFIDEIDVAQLDSYELAWMRCHKIGYIFQSYNILPVLTALENVTLPMAFAGLSPDESREKGAEILKLVGLGDRIFHRPYELSGGQQQRIAIARALANRPQLLLADEPTGELDSATAHEILALFQQISEAEQVTILMVSHSDLVDQYVDQGLRLQDGLIMADSQ